MDMKNIVMGVGLDGRFQGSSREDVHAEVVFIDQTRGPMYSVLYQLRREFVSEKDFESNEPTVIQLPQGAVMMMGEVSMIDRKNKIIYLSNNNTVRYNHLVIATGIREKDEQFTAALHSLLEAIRIRRKLPLTISSPYGLFKPLPNEHFNQTAINPNVGSQVEAKYSLPQMKLQELINASLPKEVDKGKASLSEEERSLFYLTS